MSVYERSKHEGEVAAFAAARNAGIDLVAVLPSSVQGPGRAGGTGKILIAYLNGKLKAFVDTRISLVDIDDTIEAHVLAAERGKPGERYLISGATITSHGGVGASSAGSPACGARSASSRRSPRARSARPSRPASARAGASRRCAAR